MVGSAIRVAGIRDSDGAVGIVSVNTSAGAGAVLPPQTITFWSTERLVNQTIFYAEGLDPSDQHTLTLWYDVGYDGNYSEGSRFMRIETMTVTFPSAIRCEARHDHRLKLILSVHRFLEGCNMPL